MGRIAEALRRAQHERAQRLGGSSALPVESSSRPEKSEALIADVPAMAGATDELSAIFRPPPPPLPFTVNAVPIEGTGVGREVLAFHEPTSAIAEKYRSVRTRLLTANPGGSARVLAVTSTLPREGKTVTVANLGFSLAELRHLRVAMVDLDLRRAGLTALLHARELPGICEVLRGEKRLAEVCVPVVRENLFFVPAGDPQKESPSDLLAGDRVAQVFKEIRERFHYTLADTPPINAFADIGLIGPLCHSVLIVVRMNQTPEPLLRRSVKMLQANQLPITGCVLAGCSDEAAYYGDNQDYYVAEG
ncbi:MAG: CpsD/CapB family tyrosine-protein kinase [Phycisphaerae bacterium]|nr:CpsD/CapB family tyrosine-protein kinase [Phycisphaerae bacterium]